jgi:Winged helix DNA-binding domain
MLKLTWRKAAAWRVQRHYLDKRAPAGSLLEAASRLCGLHAQLMSSAELMAWARVEDLKRDAVRQALWAERTLVKTWAMRGTLHLLPAKELPMWHAVLGTSKRFLRESAWKKYYGITLKELDQITQAIGTALDGRVLTREELAKEVARITRRRAFGPKVALSSWGTLLRPAAFTGLLCFGPSEGQLVRFTRPTSWLECVLEAVDPQIATAEITRRFLAAYGPATIHDLARWWTGGGVATAKQWISSLGDEACPVDLEGTQAWILAAHADQLREAEPSRSVRLLPGFDQYVIGASFHAERLLPGKERTSVYRPQGWISPVLLVDGLMQGIWRHEIKGSRVEITIEPFVKVPAWMRRVTGHEAERLAAFLGGSLTLVWKA